MRSKVEMSLSFIEAFHIDDQIDGCCLFPKPSHTAYMLIKQLHKKPPARLLIMNSTPDLPRVF